MFLQKKRITSNASRLIYSLIFKVKQIGIFKPFFFKHVKARGRSKYNGKVARTKSSVKTTARLIKPYFSFKFLNGLVYTVAFKKVGLKSKVSSLNSTADGLFLLLPKLEFQALFTFYRLKSDQKVTKFFSSLVNYIILVQKRVLVCYIEGANTFIAAFVKAPGSIARIRNQNTRLKSVLVDLPSNARKYFLFSSLCLIGTPHSCLTTRTWSTKSGYYRKFGVNTLSRGVARNPVDHPNGGRTKALRCPKTPWGLVAKKK
jgi:hypothetical protein